MERMCYAWLDFPEPSGPTTAPQRKARQDAMNRPYIDYKDAEMVAREVELQRERVAEAKVTQPT